MCANRARGSKPGPKTNGKKPAPIPKQVGKPQIIQALLRAKPSGVLSLSDPTGTSKTYFDYATAGSRTCFDVEIYLPTNPKKHPKIRIYLYTTSWNITKIRYIVSRDCFSKYQKLDKIFRAAIAHILSDSPLPSGLKTRQIGPSGFLKMVMPLIRKTYPQQLASTLVNVQPLTAPTALIHYLKPRKTGK